MKSLPKRIGIFGGTFSPPHLGHISSAENFIQEECLDELIIIPTYKPPHKDISYSLSPDTRFEMCKIAFEKIEKAVVSDIEIKRQGKSYTYNTLCQLKEKYPDATFILLCGTDMILTFDEWYNFEEIFKMAEIVYKRREKEDLISEQISKKICEYKEKYNAEVRELKGNVIEISSTELRLAISGGKDTSRFLTKEIKDYIEKWNVYQAN